GDDQVTYAQHNAYGNSFPDANKPYNFAGWFFSVDQTFDIAVAQQLYPSQTYLDTIVGNMNYEAGCNPLNVAFLTGIGQQRQRVTVSQYAENDRRILPPSGIPLGSVQYGPPYLLNYRGELDALCFPSDSAGLSPYAPYDKWSDTWNVTTEMVNPQEGHSLASMAYMMGRTAVKNQPWNSATGFITGLPAKSPAQQNITASLVVPGVDLSNANVVWEGSDQQPTQSTTFTFAPVNTGQNWVEAEALLPDGRRIFAKTQFVATASTSTPHHSYEFTPLPIASDMIALYHFDFNLYDVTGRQNPLTTSGFSIPDTENLAWMQNHAGAALHFFDVGDTATVTIPAADTYASDTEGVMVEAMIYVNEFKGYQRANSPLISFEHNWASNLELREDMYEGPFFKGGQWWGFEVRGPQVANALSKGVWHHVQMIIDQSGYTMKVDGVTVGSAYSSDFYNWAVDVPRTLTIGNFDGWIYELSVRNI
ncbi:MAG: hypothetical protein ACR2H1_00765, partial [Limisphaerales bacterium]